MIPRTYRLLPDLPDAGLLQRYLETLGIIVPAARTNMVLNPSLETNSTNWANTGVGTTVARSTEQQYHGAYSLKVTLDTGAGGSDDGAGYGGTTGLTTSAGATYAVSAKVRGVAGVGYYLMFGTSTTSPLARVAFTGTGRWQWVWLLVTDATGGSNRQIFIVRDGTGGSGATVNAPIYIDGVQCELCASGELWPTTYIDGDQLGLVPNQYPPAYGWNGTPHASTSYRTGQTRAGGRVVNLKSLGFLLTTIIGLGMAPPRHEALTFAQLDGGQYQNTLKPPRTFSLAGRIAAATPNAADVALAQLGTLVDRDRVAQRQSLVLTMQARECGVDCGDMLTIPALYSGGLEGQTNELPTYQVPITFTQYLPYIQAGDQGAALVVSQDVANTRSIAARSPSGQWSNIGSGVSGLGTPTVYAITRGLNGLIYVGGDFTDAGGTGADYLASYNPVTGTWAALGSTTAINGIVRALAIGPDGRLYVGGSFTNASGIANADGIAVWDPVAGTWAALSTGTAGSVWALAFSPAGILYAGGSFTSIGGIGADYIAQWNGSAWSNLASDTAINGPVQALAWGNSRLYVGGAFTNAGGVADADNIATWNGSAWGALSTGMNSDVLALAVGTNGLVYAGGLFTTAGGLSIPYVAVWNGQQWAALGDGVSGTVRALTVGPDGSVYAGGVFTTASGITLPDGFARWNGATWLPFDINFVGTATIYALLLTPDGTLYVGYDTNPVSTAAGITTITNSGTAEVYPVLVLEGTSGVASTVYQFVNTTTGKGIYFRNLIISPGERMTLTLDPKNVTFVSTFQGNIISSIAPGSVSTQLVLQPGNNTISLFVSGGAIANATLQWQKGYNRLNDALYEAVAL